MTVETERGGVKAHPLLITQKQAEDGAIKLGKALGLTSEVRQIEDTDEIEEFTKSRGAK